MLFIYHSNESTTLIKKACQIMQDHPLDNPFQYETFLINNKELEQWIKIVISDSLGIYSNIMFYHINEFIWKLFNQSIPFISNNYQFKKDYIFWKLIKLSKEYNFKTTNKIKNENQIINFAIAISKLFNQYIIYRPDWITSWNYNFNIPKFSYNHQIWQKKLWKLITNFNFTSNEKLSYFDIESLVIKKLTLTKKSHYGRFFIFDTTHIPNMYLETLIKLSKFYDIHILLHTYFNLKKVKLKKNILNIKSKKSLLFSLGIHGFNHINYWNKKNIYNNNVFQNISGQSLLHKIQKKSLSEINYSKLCKKVKNNKNYFYSNDNSISIHICHSIQQEVDILYLNISKILKKKNKLLLHEILVVAHNINLYLPYITSISNKQGENKINLFSSNKMNDFTQNAIKLLKMLLTITDNEFTYEEIFLFLESPLINEQFLINTNHLSTLKKHLEKSGFKLKINQNHSKKKNNIQQNSWEFGINRIFLGHAINKKKIWNNTLPYYEIKDDVLETISKINIFLQAINQWKKKLSIKKTAKNWITIIQDLINIFFPKIYHCNKLIISILNRWEIMIKNAMNVHFKQKISIKMLKTIFFKKNINFEFNSNFFNKEKINFCNLKSCNLISSKIIYCLGMSKDNYPKDDIITNDNMLFYQPKIGDFNQKNYDFYSFFRILMNTKKQLFISYIVNPTCIDKIECCSIVVKKLKDYIIENFSIKNRKINTKKKLIINHLFKTHPLYQFKKKYLKNKKNINLTQEHNSKTNKTKIESLSKLQINSIEFNNFINFWKHPVKFIFNFRLNLYLNKKHKKDLNNEPFEIDPVYKYKIKNKILTYMIRNKNTKKLFKTYKLSGILPYGNFGKLIWEKYEEQIFPLAKKISNLKLDHQKKCFNLKINKLYLNECIIQDHLNTGILKYKPSSINMIDILSLWLEHLIYCISGGKFESQLFGIKNSSFLLPNLKIEKAKYYLIKYLNGYISGLHTPILLTRSGGQWIKKEFSNKKKFVNLSYDNLVYKNIFLKLWHGNSFISGENQDLYLQKIIPILNEETIKEIYITSKTWFKPILIHQIKNPKK